MWFDFLDGVRRSLTERMCSITFLEHGLLVGRTPRGPAPTGPIAAGRSGSEMLASWTG